MPAVTTRRSDRGAGGADRQPAVDATGATRRAVLAGTGAAVGAALAGCLGGAGAGEAVSELPPPVLGDPDAAVTVAAYEDFSCPHCATFSLEVLPRLRAAYLEPGRVRYEHHDFPIPVDEWSWPVASAARAVQDGVGDEAFFAYAHRLYRNRSRYSVDRLVALAEAVGADGRSVRRAARRETYRPVVEADRERGLSLGVRGTPAVLVDGQLLPDARLSTVRDAVEAVR